VAGASGPAARARHRRARLLVVPGLVNGHHHMFQSLTRASAPARAVLFDWLKLLYGAWRHLDPDAAYVEREDRDDRARALGRDDHRRHLYLYPNGVRLEDTIRAARELGVRFHPTRGAMTLGQSQGSFVPDDLVERDDAVLEDSLRLLQTLHDPEPGSMLRIGLAPCRRSTPRRT